MFFSLNILFLILKNWLSLASGTCRGEGVKILSWTKTGNTSNWLLLISSYLNFFLNLKLRLEWPSQVYRIKDKHLKTVQIHICLFTLWEHSSNHCTKFMLSKIGKKYIASLPILIAFKYLYQKKKKTLKNLLSINKLFNILFSFTARRRSSWDKTLNNRISWPWLFLVSQSLTYDHQEQPGSHLPEKRDSVYFHDYVLRKKQPESQNFRASGLALQCLSPQVCVF